MIFYILACGPSINSITDEEWEYLRNKETIGFATFPFKDKETKYHMATESFFDDKQTLVRMKNNGFINTKVFTHKDETYDLAIRLGFDTHKILVRKGRRNFGGRDWLHKQKIPGRLLDNFGKTIDDPMFTHRGQMSTVLNIAYTFNPTEIRLIGVDLNSQKHFFDDDPKLERLTKYHKYIESKKKRKNWDPKTGHASTRPIDSERGLLVTTPEIIDQLNKELDDIKIYVCSRDSLLCTEGILDYKGIME